MTRRPPTITSNICPGCSRVFQSIQAVRGHLSHCPGRAAASPPPTPEFVAAVRPAPATPPSPPPAAAAPPPPAAPPAFVADVAVPPPPPAPPPPAEQTQYVPQMPLPNAPATSAAVPLAEWKPPAEKAPMQLAELNPPAPGTVSVTVAGEAAAAAALAAAPGTAIVPAKSVVDVVKVLQVLSKRVFTWEGPGPLTDEECEMLRAVITWQPGPAAGATVLLSAVFLPRLLTFPPLADRLGKLFVAGLDRLIAELGGDVDDAEPAPAKTPTRRAESSPAAANDASPAAPVPAAVKNREDVVRDAWAAAGVTEEDKEAA